MSAPSRRLSTYDSTALTQTHTCRTSRGEVFTSQFKSQFGYPMHRISSEFTNQSIHLGDSNNVKVQVKIGSVQYCANKFFEKQKFHRRDSGSNITNMNLSKLSFDLEHSIPALIHTTSSIKRTTLHNTHILKRPTNNFPARHEQ